MLKLCSLQDEMFFDEIVVAEIRTTNKGFIFKHIKNEKVFFSKCEFCYQKRVLRVECACKRVRYCNEACQKKDIQWHRERCSALADEELKQGGVLEKSANARMGKVGLSNIGNTCYMNSSL